MTDDKKPEPPPLDAERERLRAQGYNDAEISQILIARALGGGAGPTGAPVHPQGIFSNVLNSIVAVASYTGGLFTSIRTDIATILDRSSAAGARGSAFVAVAIKAVVIGVLAFAAWQEWQQHVISQTEIADAQARKLKIEADNAKVLNEAQAKKLQAEADNAKALNEAQVKKLESEAEVSRELNESQTRKTRAEECSARMKAAIDTVPMNELGTATEAIQRDCDPNYAARAKACEEKFKAFITTVGTLDFKDTHPSDTLLAAAKDYKAECPFGPDQQEATKAALQRRQDKLDKLRNIIASLKPSPKGEASPTVEPTPTASVEATATPEPSPTREARAPTQYDNYDFAGNDDLEHFASDSPDACLSACRENSSCRSVTFDKWNKVCFLKGEGKKLWFNAHGVSAFIDPDTTPEYADAPMYIMRVPGRGFPRAGGTNYAASADTCDDSCRTTSWCAADTFFRSSHQCMMLQTTGEYFPNNDADAGIKRQKNY